MSKHVFAFYKENLSEHVGPIGADFSIKDPALWNRLTKIVRIKPGDRFILFDDTHNFTIVASEDILTTKRLVSGTIESIEKNKAITPELTLYLPILKKDAFEYVIYVAAQMGVSRIVPIVTQKSEQKEYDLDRVSSIMIAACEQSKNFVQPTIELTQKLQEIEFDESLKILFDEHGDTFVTFDTRSKLRTQDERIQNIALTIGPEGGFTKDEKKSLHKAGFISFRLTPTILRSREAAALGIGIVRSII